MLERKLKPEENGIVDKLYWKMQKEGALRRYANRFVIDKSFVDDVIQTTFLIACEKIEALIVSPNREGYIMFVLKNTIKNFNRVGNKIAQMLSSVSEQEWLENYLESKEDEDDLDLLYGDLVKYKEYELLKEFAVKRRKIADIAKDLGISENACKLRIFRGKRKLREILESRK